MQVKPPATEEMGVVELKMLVHQHDIPAISNLTFHEVADVRDKALLIREALRVVRKGGQFAFQDLFLWKALYGDLDALLDTMRGWGIQQVELINTSEAPFIPRLLKLPFMAGTIAIIHGIV